MSRGRSEGPSDTAVLAIIGCAVATCAAVWLWGGAAGALFGRGWPPAGFAQILGVLVRLPARLSDPATAWPAAARSRLPGPAGFYAALAVLIAGAAGAVAVARRAGAVGMLRASNPGARWASGNDVRILHRRRPLLRRRSRHGAGRLILGRHDARLLYAEERHALVAFGPPQSGKSAGLAVPALLEWAGPAVASSIKTDLLAVTVKRRRALGPVFVF
ncbi:MAG TPA: type IV secretory system conjugative DNA transfer family protein, partial [Solirubrobacteraceae bacterium]|nr:type IV secretory system conjugative DNA transfer family protein [Solirubrobacteraceae bacterium]